MSLDKAIASGKEHRKPYRKGKAAFGSCRNHGGCPHCEGNRTIGLRMIDEHGTHDLVMELTSDDVTIHRAP